MAWKTLDFYIEAEYVREQPERTTAMSTRGVSSASGPSSGCAWASPASARELYDNDRDIQRGPFVQVTWGPVTIGGYWFNPGRASRSSWA